MKARQGRGFTLDELKAAGLNAKYARTVGIAVDHRRKSHSEEAMSGRAEGGGAEREVRADGGDLAVDHRRKSHSEEAMSRNVQKLEGVPEQADPLYPLKQGQKATKGPVVEATADQLKTPAEGWREADEAGPGRHGHGRPAEERVAEHGPGHPGLLEQAGVARGPA
eukprot:Sspe_Gene.3062::Locus_1011_Transcript_69_72_Confidence_0.016_Length_1437::g.3062::m.3062/K02873/RP-L13e, RPL13; large subunit ribosomal protein L13e